MDTPDNPETPPPAEEPAPPPPPAAGPPPPPGPYGPGGMNWPAGARMPIPGNAEWALWFAVEILFAIIWAASDAVDASGFVTASAIITFAYLISRGIAKASRVLEQ
jgi:hypothetical protein